MQIADIALPMKGRLGPSWKVVLDWDRNQGYDPNPMPRKVARSMIEAAFGQEGVVTWIKEALA